MQLKNVLQQKMERKQNIIYLQKRVSSNLKKNCFAFSKKINSSGTLIELDTAYCMLGLIIYSIKHGFLTDVEYIFFLNF